MVHLPRKENAWSRHQHLFEENIGKNKMEKVKGLRILKMRVRELFMHEEGISTPCTCHKGRQPLIECARHDFKTMYFPLFYVFYAFSLFIFYYPFLAFYVFYFFGLFMLFTFLGFLCFLLFWGRQGYFPRSYVFLNCDEEIRPT